MNFFPFLTLRRLRRFSSFHLTSFLLLISISILTTPLFSAFADEPIVSTPPKESETPSIFDRAVEDGLPDEIVFAVRKPSVDGHWYGNIGYYSFDNQKPTFPIHSGGKLLIYNVQTKELRTLFDAPQGNVRDPAIDYDAKKVLFSYLPKDEKHYSLYEIDLDGSNLTRLTGFGKEKKPFSGELETTRTDGWDDIEPCYLPDGGIVFCSSRVNRYVQCWLTQVATLFRCDADGENARQLSCNVEQDNTPWILNDGRIAYMRWEYVDRNHLTFHHLHTAEVGGSSPPSPIA